MSNKRKRTLTTDVNNSNTAPSSFGVNAVSLSTYLEMFVVQEYKTTVQLLDTKKLFTMV